jgi:hypothetical protein
MEKVNETLHDLYGIGHVVLFVVVSILLIIVR